MSLLTHPPPPPPVKFVLHDLHKMAAPTRYTVVDLIIRHLNYVSKLYSQKDEFLFMRQRHFKISNTRFLIMRHTITRALALAHVLGIRSRRYLRT